LVGNRAEPLNNEPFMQCPLGLIDRIYNYILSWEAVALYRRAFSEGNNVSHSFYTTKILTLWQMALLSFLLGPSLVALIVAVFDHVPQHE
jgi:hypothetical protein